MGGIPTVKTAFLAFDVEHAGKGAWESPLFQIGMAYTIFTPGARRPCTETVSWVSNTCVPEDEWCMGFYAPDHIKTTYTKEACAAAPDAKTVLREFFTRISSLGHKSFTTHSLLDSFTQVLNTHFTSHSLHVSLTSQLIDFTRFFHN